MRQLRALLLPLVVGAASHDMPPDRTFLTTICASAPWNRRGDVSLISLLPSHLDMLTNVTSDGLAANAIALCWRRSVSGADSRAGAGIIRERRRSINHYGPTETTVHALTYELESHLTLTSVHSPIGRPICEHASLCFGLLVWSLYLRGLLGSFTYRVLGWRAAMLVVRG